MKLPFISSVLSRRLILRWLIGATWASGLCTGSARAQQSMPKTSDIDFAVAADGSLNMAFQMTFDAANWRSWKAMVGDEPARMRAQMRHQFAAMTLEDFKLERDDMNRVAKMSMHSPSGPDLREDGSFQIPVDGYFRLVNHTGNEWFFSGNNPNAGGTLNNVKVTLPANVTEAHVINADNPDQALVFTLAAAPSPSRWFYLAGSLVSLTGLVLISVGLFARRGQRLALPAGHTPLLPQTNFGRAASPPPFAPVPITPPAFTPPSAVPPPFTPRQTNRVTPPAIVPKPASEPAPEVVAEEPAPLPEEPPQPAAIPPPFMPPATPPAAPPPYTYRPSAPPPIQPRGGYAEPD